MKFPVENMFLVSLASFLKKTAFPCTIFIGRVKQIAFSFGRRLYCNRFGASLV